MSDDTCVEPGCHRKPWGRRNACRYHYEARREARIQASQPYDAVADAAHLRTALLVADSGVELALRYLSHGYDPSDVLEQVNRVLTENRTRIEEDRVNDVEAKVVREELRLLRDLVARLRKENEALRAQIKGAA